MEALQIIDKANILSDENINELQLMKDDLLKTFKNVQVFRTPTEMEVSVLDDLKHPTPDSKYWQAVREQNVMLNELVMLSYEYQKNLQNIEILNAEIKEIDYKIEENTDLKEYEIEKLLAEQRIKQIEISEKTFISMNQQKTAHARFGEIKEWNRIKDNLEEHLVFGSEDVNKHQLGSYLRRFINQYISLVEYRPKDVSISELNNLKGQLISSLRVADESGILKEVLSIYSPEQLKMIGIEAKYV